MSVETPKRIQSDVFSPITLRQSPGSASFQKNLTGLQKLAHGLALECCNNVQKWNEVFTKGYYIVKQIAALKAENPKNYEAPLENLVDGLYSILIQLAKVKTQLNTTVTRAKAMADMQKVQEPLFISLNACQFANVIKDLAEAYESDFQDKKLVLENIAHSKSKEEAMFYAAMWTYQCKISEDVNFKLETLKVESGLRKIT